MKLGICSVDYRFKEDKPAEICLVCRDSKNRRHIVTVDSFYPYFYIEKRFLNTVYPLLLDYNCSVTNEEYNSIDGDRVVKIIAPHPWEVGKIRMDLHHMGIYTYEADVLFSLRFLIDNNIFYSIEYDPYNHRILGNSDLEPKLRWIAIDIEVYAENQRILEDYSGEIIVISVYDSYTDTIRVFTTGKIDTYSIKEISEHLIDKNIKIEIGQSNTEKKLLQEFKKYFIEIEPDVVLSFSRFDMNYIIHRMDKVLKYASLSPLGVVSLRDTGSKIAGVQILDITEMFSTTLRRSKWETLEDIAEQELHQKTLFHDENVYDMWKNRRYLDVILRNVRDTELVKMLNEELELLTYFDTIRKAVGCNLSDALIRSRIFDVLDLRMARRYNVVLPSRRYYRKYQYEGAKVFSCKRGIYDNVLVVDFKGMYPSIIKAFNIGYTTFIHSDIKDDFVTVKDLKNRFRVGNIPSFVVEEINMLEPLREPYKEAMKHTNGTEYRRNKAVSDALKSVINALYGKFGYPGNYQKHIKASRLYDPLIAAAITKIGRECQTAVYNYLKDKKKVLYGDTDSLFIQLDSENIHEEAEQIVNDLNSFLENFLVETYNVEQVTLKLEIDKIFKRLVLLTKKRYAGLKEDGTIEWKGLEAIKRDQALVTQEIQKELIKRILVGQSKYEIEKFFIEYTRDFKNKSISEIAIPLKLNKSVSNYSSIPYHLKAFVYSKSVLGMDLREGERFYLVYIKEVPEGYPDSIKISTDKVPERTYKIEAIALPRRTSTVDFPIDYDKMLERTVINKSMDILDLLGINTDKILRVVTGYKTLEEYM